MLHRFESRLLGGLAVVLVASGLLFGIAPPALATPPPLTLDAKSALLIDFETGQVLFELAPDTPIPPASLTKLMTLHLALSRIAAGKMKLEEKVEVSQQAWAAKMPDSSVMWLEPGQHVTVGEILKGVAIASGNDASIALAQHMSGSVESFVALMNQEAQAMGYKVMQFADPHGLSAQNMVTAREFADFSRRYIQMHPQALVDLHSVREYHYPLYENLPEKRQAAISPSAYTGAIWQPNRNLVLDRFEGTDGLKTGFIDESGYNIALTTKRGDMRLVAVILGVPGQTEAEGSERRAAAGISLLGWGFQHYITVHPAVPDMQSVRVYKGAADQLTVETERPVVITVENGLETKLVSTVVQEPSVVAPVTKGSPLGELVYTADGNEVARFKLVAAADVEQGGLFKRLWHSLLLMVKGWLGQTP